MSTQFSGPTIGSAQGLYDNSTRQMHVLGETIFTNDGRAFRYVFAGGVTLVSGKVHQAPAEDTTNFNPSGGLAIAAQAIGDTSITTTSTVTLTANQLAGGTVSIVVTPGVGKIYKIKSHPAATAAVVTLQLEDPIQVALTTSSKINIEPSPYSGVIVMPTTATGAPVGVSVCPIVTLNYGWLQVAGHGTILCDATGTITPGASVMNSGSVAGAVRTLTVGSNVSVVGISRATNVVSQGGEFKITLL